MQAITEKGGEGVAGKGREEDERDNGVGEAIICFDLKELIGQHTQSNQLLDSLHT